MGKELKHLSSPYVLTSDALTIEPTFHSSKLLIETSLSLDKAVFLLHLFDCCFLVCSVGLIVVDNWAFSALRRLFKLHPLIAEQRGGRLPTQKVFLLKS